MPHQASETHCKYTQNLPFQFAQACYAGIPPQCGDGLVPGASLNVSSYHDSKDRFLLVTLFVTGELSSRGLAAFPPVVRLQPG